MLAGRSQARPSKYASDTDDDRVNDSTTYRQVLESSDEVGSDEEDVRITSSDDSDDDVPLVSKYVNKGGTEDWVSEDEDTPAEDEENLSEDGSEELSELSTQQNPAAGKYFLIISIFRPYSNQAQTKSLFESLKITNNLEGVYAVWQKEKMCLLPQTPHKIAFLSIEIKSLYLNW